MSREGKIHFWRSKTNLCWYRISLRDHTDLILFPHKKKNKVTKYWFFEISFYYNCFITRNCWYFMCVQLGCRFYFVSWDHVSKWLLDFWWSYWPCDHDPSRCIFPSLRRYDHLTNLNWQLILYGIFVLFFDTGLCYNG